MKSIWLRSDTPITCVDAIVSILKKKTWVDVQKITEVRLYDNATKNFSYHVKIFYKPKAKYLADYVLNQNI